MFTPILLLAKKILGDSKIDDWRNRAIFRHIQVINYAGKLLGISKKDRQHLIQLSHRNGKYLGLLT
jgi:hypothetical protein